jgi:hypothetical protein
MVLMCPQGEPVTETSGPVRFFPQSSSRRAVRAPDRDHTRMKLTLCSRRHRALASPPPPVHVDRLEQPDINDLESFV